MFKHLCVCVSECFVSRHLGTSNPSIKPNYEASKLKLNEIYHTLYYFKWNETVRVTMKVPANNYRRSTNKQ